MPVYSGMLTACRMMRPLETWPLWSWVSDVNLETRPKQESSCIMTVVGRKIKRIYMMVSNDLVRNEGRPQVPPKVNGQRVEILIGKGI